MQTKLTHGFLKDLNTLPKPIKKRILEIVSDCENTESVNDIQNRKALYAKQNRDFFRIRVGDYRVGVQVLDNVLVFEKIRPRGDFYKVYPPK